MSTQFFLKTTLAPFTTDHLHNICRCQKVEQFYIQNKTCIFWGLFNQCNQLLKTMLLTEGEKRSYSLSVNLIFMNSPNSFTVIQLCTLITFVLFKPISSTCSLQV